MKLISYIPIFFLLFFTFSIFYKSDNSFDQDLGRHIKLGEIIVSEHYVPKINLFSYTNSDFPFINHHFLFEVFVYYWSTLINLEYFLYFKIFIILLSVSIILAIVKKTNYPLLLPLGYLFLHVLRERTDLRPEIFSYLFISLTFFVLEKFSSDTKTKLIFILPFIQFFWVNTHIYFFLGLILQVIYIFDCLLKKELLKCRILAVVLFLSFIACLLNPNTFNGLLYPLKIFDNYGYTVAENQSLVLLESIGFKNNNFVFVKLCSVIILLSIIISLLKKTWSLKNILIALMGMVMAYMNIRSFPLLFFLCFPIVLQNFDVKKYNRFILLINCIFLVLLLAESIQYLNGSYYKNNYISNLPKLSLEEDASQAMDYLLNYNLPQPIYNNFDIGSYIIYRGYPKYKVFVDGRPEAYPASFFHNIYIPSQSDYAVFQNLDSQYNFQTIIFSISDQTPWGKNFLKNVTNDKTWSLVYLDHFMIILVKNSFAERKNFKGINLSALLPESYNYESFISYLRLGYFLQNCGYTSTAKLFTDKAFALKDSP